MGKHVNNNTNLDAAESPGSRSGTPTSAFFHWALAACFAVAYLTGEDAEKGSGLHIWAGYAICALLITRVIWGFIGSAHARFSDFTFGPAATLRYLKDMLGGRAKRYLGHSPAGAAMIFALLICLTGTIWTGLQVYAEEGKGPLASNGIVMTQARADEHHGGGERHDIPQAARAAAKAPPPGCMRRLPT